MLRHFVTTGMAMLVAAATQAAEVEAVCFTPGQDCTAVVVGQIASAHQQVLVQAYSFTSPEILKALTDARKRGIDVRIILDKSNVCKDDGAVCEKKSAVAVETLGIAQIPTLIDRRHAIAHNKIMIVDRQKVITGSFNFTRAANEKNAENILVLRDPGLVRRYEDNWREHAAHSGSANNGS